MVWPKEFRRLAQRGIVVDAVIVGFRGTTDRDTQARAHWVDDAGELHVAQNGMPALRPERRMRGDVVTIVVDPADPRVSVQLSEIVTGPKDGRVEATVVALEPAPGFGSHVRVRFGDREAVVGPVLGSDPRRPGDVVDLIVDPASGAIVREPSGPAGDVECKLAEMRKEPGLLRKIWDSPFFP